MTQVCTLGRWTRKDIFLSHNHACMRRETRELVHSFPLESAFLTRLKTCIATLLLATKNADMVDDDTAVLEGPKGKTRDADWGFRYLHIIEKVKYQDVIYHRTVCFPYRKSLVPKSMCIYIISSILSYL